MSDSGKAAPAQPEPEVAQPVSVNASLVEFLREHGYFDFIEALLKYSWEQRVTDPFTLLTDPVRSALGRGEREQAPRPEPVRPVPSGRPCLIFSEENDWI